MYKVLLVEDEQIVRLALKTLVDWEQYNFDMNYEANNGQQALYIIKRNPDIDIIITDINMPVMDGLTLIYEVQKLKVNPAMIVLSAYDDYDLVRNAFKLGIYDYILKTKMEPEEVLNLLQRVIKDRKQSNVIRTEGKYSQNDRTAFLKNLLEDSRLNDVTEQMTMYEIKLEKENIVACFLWVDNYKNIVKRYEDNTLKSFTQGVSGTISQILVRMKMGEVISISPDAYVILLSFKTNSNFIIREKIEEIIKKIRHALLHYMNVEISVGISTIKNGYKNISCLFHESHSNAKFRYILGKGKNIFPEDTAYIKQCDSESIIGKEMPLLNAIKSMDKEKTLYELDKLLSLLGMFKGVAVEETFGYYMELIFIIIHYLNEIDEDSNTIFEHNTDFYAIIRSFDTKQEIHQWIKNLINNLLDYLIQKKDTKNSRIVLKAQNYLEKNYMNKLTLLDVSQHIQLSEGYFSKLFTQETGESFKQYLTRIRITKAKELLAHTNMKIYEICEQIGYENVEHFSRVFKKEIGISPLQYKKSS